MENARRRLTREEVALLKPYEENMRTALDSDWTRGLGGDGVRAMKAVLESMTGKKHFVVQGCAGCVLRLARTVGRWYFEDVLALAREGAVNAESGPVASKGKGTAAAGRKSAKKAKKAPKA